MTPSTSTGDAKSKRKSKSKSDDSPSAFTRLESPDLDAPMVIDMGIDALAAFIGEGIKDGGVWSTSHEDGSVTIVNVGAVRTFTLTPIEGEPDPGEVRHLQPGGAKD